MIKELLVKDRKKWNEIIEGFETKDVYFTYDYFIPFKINGDGEPNLFYFECDHGKIAYPFMLRDIADCINLAGIIEKNRYFDISSAYGYGGPIFQTYDSEADIVNLHKAFQRAFTNYCEQANIISQFDRFHPLIKNHNVLKGYSELIPIRNTVHMDISDENNIWENIDSKCRNMIRKAIKNDIKIVIENDFTTLDAFKYIYNTTMNCNNALDYYYFNDTFFEDTAESLRDHVVVVNAYYKDRIIASSLIMKHSKYLHYHFSGALRDYRNLQANNLLLYEVAKWGNKNNYKYFHLGGGYESSSDSLFKFKKSFSKIDANDFYIGKRIHNLELYNQLTNIVNEFRPGRSSFFPEYRK